MNKLKQHFMSDWKFTTMIIACALMGFFIITTLQNNDTRLVDNDEKLLDLIAHNDEQIVEIIKGGLQVDEHTVDSLSNLVESLNTNLTLLTDVLVQLDGRVDVLEEEENEPTKRN